MKTYQVGITFIEPILGTVPKDKEIYTNYIASKAKPEVDTEDEVETVPADEELSNWTGFHLVDGNPVLYNYVIKGFFKDACSMLRRVSGTGSSKLTAFKKVIDGLVFVTPRRIPIENFNEIGILERPLRAQTPKGERVALTRSDICPAGSMIIFTVELMAGVTEKLLKEWLDYGFKRGLGQWRNAGYGSFTYEISKV